MKDLKSNRLHIGIFGKTNVGKSSVLNRITGQDVSVVSDIAGTTTDVVEKSMELLPIGPVTFLDTAGIDDKSELGYKRIEKTFKTINRIDVAVIVTESNNLDADEKVLIKKLEDLSIPYFILVNKCDKTNINTSNNEKNIYTSALYDENLVFKFKDILVKTLPAQYLDTPAIASDLVKKGSTVILVVPIDKEAPKGRLILPQVQTIRDLLDGNIMVYTVKDSELDLALKNLKTSPSLVITDSQAFKKVDDIVPKEIPLTSFSILFARLKGDLKVFAKGAETINELEDEDKILILESCCHHAIEDDIGKVKIPNLLKKRTGKNLIFEHYSGHDFPDVSNYKLIIHCGACMTNRREVLSRIIIAQNKGVAITNYGMAISYCLGIMQRAMKPFNT